jgi:hypothetical protein
MARSTLDVWSLVVTLVCLGIFAYAYVEGQSFRSPANGFPIVISAAGLLVSAANAAVSIRKIMRSRREASDAVGTTGHADEPIFVDGQELTAPTQKRLREGAAVFVGLFVVAFAIESFGFVLTAPVSLIICFRWLGTVSWQKATIGALLFTILFSSLARLMGFVLPGAFF